MFEPRQAQGGVGLRHEVKTVAYDDFILIIDSAPAQGSLIAAGCRALGFQSDYIETIVNLDPILAHIRPSAIITDMRVAGRDGLDVMRAVAFVDRSIHLLITAFDIQKFREVIGAVQGLYSLKHVLVLPKPIWSDSLAMFLNQVSPR